MSNVLIGIIGVILFIGLALAGALILGDDFKSSKSSTAAAKTISDMQQIVAAVNMRTLKTGSRLVSSDYATNVASLTPRFLKVVPTVPISGGRYETPDANGNGSSLPIHHIQARLGPISDETAKAVCREIEAQSGAADPDTAIAAVTTTAAWGPRVANSRGVGCFRYDPDGGYWAFLVI